MSGDRRGVVSALKWSAAAKLSGQLIMWALTIVVMRLLNPADYGLMAMGTTVIAFAAMLSEMGLGTAIVQMPKYDPDVVRSIAGMVLLLNLALTLVVMAASPLAALFFHEPRVSAIISVSALQFFVNAIGVAPDAILRREMRFQSLAYVEVAAGVVAGVSTLSCAFYGLGVWSLVLGNLIGALYRTVALFVTTRKFIVPSLRLKGLRKVLIYGGQLTTSRVLWFVMSQTDVLIAGRMLGKDALGQYSLALQLATLPMQKAMSVINQVTFPLFSRSQDKPAELVAAVDRSIQLLTLCSVPILWGIASVAPEFVETFLGSAWAPAVVPLQLVALVVPVRMVSAFLSTAICAVGRADIDLRNTLVGAVVMPAAYLVGATWGLYGLAASTVFAVPVLFCVYYRSIAPVLGLRMRRLLRLVAPSLVAGIVMVITVALARAYLAVDFAPAAKLSLLVLVGAVAYIGSAALLDPGMLKDLRTLARNE